MSKRGRIIETVEAGRGDVMPPPALPAPTVPAPAQEDPESEQQGAQDGNDSDQ